MATIIDHINLEDRNAEAYARMMRNSREVGKILGVFAAIPLLPRMASLRRVEEAMWPKTYRRTVRESAMAYLDEHGVIQ